MISLSESGLADAIEYADIQSHIEDVSAAVTIQRLGPVWAEHTETARSGDNFDAVIADTFLLRVYADTVSKIEVERLADESGGDEAWASITVAAGVSEIDSAVAPSLVSSDLAARIFYYTGSKIQYTENTDISTNSFAAPVEVGTVSNVIFLAAVSTTKLYYITENSNHNRVLHVYEYSGTWGNTDSDIYWPFPIHAFDAITFETDRDLLMLATDLPPLIGSRVVGTEITQEVNRVQGLATFWVRGGRWSDHRIIDTIDRVPTTTPSRASLRLSLHNDFLFGSYLRCGGTEDYPYSLAAVVRSKDGYSWEFPEIIDSLTPPFIILPRTDYLYAVGVNKVLRSPCCAWAGQTPVELDVTSYVIGLESGAAEIRNSTVHLSNPSSALSGTLAKETARLQIVHDLGYVVDGDNLRVQVSLEDLVGRQEQNALPSQGISLTTRDRLGRVNRVFSDYAAEWPGIQGGQDQYEDPSKTGYGGLRHTAPYEGSWKTPGGHEIHLVSSNKEGLAVSTMVTDALNGRAQTGFKLNTASQGEYAGIACRVFDKDNLLFIAYYLDDDVIRLTRGVGIDDNQDKERDDTVLDTSVSMSWSVDTWYYLKIVIRYSLLYAYYSTDGITWTAVNWTGAGDGNAIELDGQRDGEHLDSDGQSGLVCSGRFGMIGYGYSENDEWGGYDPVPWFPPSPILTSWGMVVLSQSQLARSWDFFPAEDPAWEDIQGAVTGTLYNITLGPERQVFLTSSDGLWYCAKITEASPSWTCIKTDASATTDAGVAGRFGSVVVDGSGTFYAPWHCAVDTVSGYFHGTASIVSWQQYPASVDPDVRTLADKSNFAAYISPAGTVYLGCCYYTPTWSKALLHTAGGGYAIYTKDGINAIGAVHDGFVAATNGDLMTSLTGDTTTYNTLISTRFGLDKMHGDLLYIKDDDVYQNLTRIAEGDSVFEVNALMGRVIYARNNPQEMVWVRAEPGTITYPKFIVWTKDGFTNHWDKTGDFLTVMGDYWAGGSGTGAADGNVLPMQFPYSTEEHA